jgi:hypothetical protein
MATTDLTPLDNSKLDEIEAAIRALITDVTQFTIYPNPNGATATITSASALTGDDLDNANRIKERFLVDQVQGGVGYKDIILDITSQTLSVKPETGETFSTSNRGFIKMPSVDRVGEYFTAVAEGSGFDQTITNTDLNNGGINVAFGTTAGRVHGDPFVLFVYVINQDDTNANVQAFISGYPNVNAKTSPASTGSNYGEVGALPSGTGRDVFVALGAPGTPANWGGKPMVCIGIIKATKSSGNVWTFSALDNDCGIGKFGQGIWWTQTKGHYGDRASSYFDNNNAPSWAAESITYTYDLSARATVRIAFTGTCTNGSNTSPLGIGLVGVSTRAYRRYIDSLKTASVQRVGGAAIVAASAQLFTTAHTNGTSLLNNALSNSADTYVAEITYQT